MKNTLQNWIELESLEKQIRKEVGSFAPQKFSHTARWVERVHDLKNRNATLQVELGERIQEAKILLSNADLAEEQQVMPVTNLEPAAFDSAYGGKARGRECRAAYVANQTKKNPLTRVRGALYRNNKGLVVGIAYAKARKNVWFLGLPAGQFKEAVLLCEGKDFKVQPIHLTESFLEKFGKRLSVSKQFNQVKFNVVSRNGRYYLVVGGHGDEDLMTYLTEPFTIS
jgi:hypothetical protein